MKTAPPKGMLFLNVLFSSDHVSVVSGDLADDAVCRKEQKSNKDDEQGILTDSLHRRDVVVCTV